ncbi:MAG: ROK family glucokinase, partial [bacterium]
DIIMPEVFIVKNQLLGIDIGGTTVKIGRFGEYGELLDKWDLPTDKTDGGFFILKNIHDAVTQRGGWSAIRGVGFGVPGPVIGGIVQSCVNIGWKNLDIANEFQKLLKTPDIRVCATNDANAACIGEMHHGAAQGCRNIFMFTLGTGIGGGVVIDGKLVEGADGLAGELGHLVVDFVHSFPCKCGKMGCLETVASATGIVNLAKWHLVTDHQPSTLRQFTTFSAKRVLDLAKSGDAVAVQTVAEATDYLGRATAAVLLTLNPDIVVFGGGVANAGAFLIDQIAAKARIYVAPFAQKTPIVPAHLGNDAGIYGAAGLVR